MTITASGQALSRGNPRGPNTFLLNLEDGDEVTKISCMLQGQGKPEIWTKTQEGGKRVEVSYRIGLVGQYKIHVTYDGKHIEGSPFNLTMA